MGELHDFSIEQLPGDCSHAPIDTGELFAGLLHTPTFVFLSAALLTRAGLSYFKSEDVGAIILMAASLS